MFNECKEAKKMMEGYVSPWGIAGGWAIDLHLGKPTRVHSDLEIAVYRNHQGEIMEHFDSWEFRKMVNGESLEWNGEHLDLPIHELHASNKENQIEVLLNEVQDGEWIFRREPSVVFPEGKLFKVSFNGIPYLNPSVTLLYKAKYAREKDHGDFLNVKDHLAPWEREWLCESLVTHLPNHQWIHLLGGNR